MAFRRKKPRGKKGDAHTRIIKAMGMLTIVCLCFGSGFILRGNDAFLERFGMDALSVDADQNPGATVSGDTFNSLSARIAEVQGFVEQDSLDDYSLDDNTRKLINGFLNSLDDEYARYYDAQEYAAYTANNSEDRYGVGVLFGDYQNKAYAVEVLAGSSAQTAGIESGDFVVGIDGEVHEDGWSLSDALKRIDGAEGETVLVTWRRPDSLSSPGGEEFTTTLTCSQVKSKSVTSRLNSDNVGYIKVRQFGRDSASLVSDAIDTLSKEGALAYVLDLRDCPGGYLEEAIQTASLFQGGGVVLQIQTADGTTSRSASGNAITELPLAVIVNSNTASAAEVVAASLQDNNRAIVVGQSTMGKGSVQIMRELSFGGAISYTVAQYLTPNGRELDGTGVSPSVVTTKTESGATDNDLSLAIEALQARIY